MQPNVEYQGHFELLNKLKKKAEKLVHQIDSCLDQYAQFYKTGSVFNKNKAAIGLLDATKNAEIITVNLREAPFYLGLPEYETEQLKNINDAFLSEYGYTEDGFFYMKIPRIPSRKADNLTVKYFRDSVYTILSNAFVTGKIQRHTFDNVVLVYRNRYSDDTIKSRWYDNDNIEYRALTNIIAAFFLYDDSPDICDCYMFSDQGNENCTELYIIPKEKFIEFLQKKNTTDFESKKLIAEYPTT